MKLTPLGKQRRKLKKKLAIERAINVAQMSSVVAACVTQIETIRWARITTAMLNEYRMNDEGSRLP